MSEAPKCANSLCANYDPECETTCSISCMVDVSEEQDGFDIDNDCGAR